MPNKFKVYKSSAGSGKTFRLTAEYLSLALINPSEFNKILAITFTIKATHEMKSRILETANAIANSGSTPLFGGAKSMLEELKTTTKLSEEILIKNATQLVKYILHDYSEFGISTIDSFSHRLIRSFAFELGLPVNFQVELDIELIIDLVIDRMLDEIGENKDITAFMTDMFKEHVAEKENINVRRRIEQTAKTMLKPESVLAVETLNSLSLKELVEAKNTMRNLYYQKLNSVQHLAEQAVALYEGVGLAKEDFSGKKGFALLNNVVAGNFNVDIEAALKKLEKDFYAQSAPANVQSSFDGISESLKAVCIEITEELPDLRTLHVVVPEIDMLCLISSLQEHHEQFRQDEELLSISDFDIMINQEVKDQPLPFIYEKIGTWYKHILIDEFQDTSVVQWQNLLPLVCEMVGDNRLALIVGDAKQSIYRWRGGEITQLPDLPKVKGISGPEIDVLTRQYVSPKMKSNYRSRNNIVDFNNELYKVIKDHSEFENLKVYKGHRQEKPRDWKGGFVRLKAFDETGLKKEEKQELRLVEMVATVKEVMERGYSPDQIVILNQSNRDNARCGIRLQEEGIPFNSKESLLVKNHPLPDVFAAFMQITLEFSDDIAYATILYGLNDIKPLQSNVHEFVAKLSALKENKYDSFKNYLDNSDCNIDLALLWTANPLEFYYHLLDRLQLPVDDAYLTGFTHAITEVFRSEGNSASAVNQYWEEARDELYISSDGGSIGVQIMTIHGSKGLEYEVVIMPFVDWDFNSKGERQWTKLNKVLSPKIPIANLPYSAKAMEGSSFDQQYADVRQMAMLDNFNKIYVATTRAKSELYIYTRKGPAKKSLKSMPSLLDYFLVHKNAAGEYESGQKTSPEKVEEVSNSEVITANHQRKGYEALGLEIKNNSQAIWKTEVQESIRFGNHVHAIMANISIKKDVDYAIDHAINQGWFTNESRAKIHEIISAITEHIDLASFFNTEGEVANEQGILLQNADVIRPDKVILDKAKKQAYLLDYKTGDERTAQTITQLGYEVVEKKLVYIDNEITVKTIL